MTPEDLYGGIHLLAILGAVLVIVCFAFWFVTKSEGSVVATFVFFVLLTLIVTVAFMFNYLRWVIPKEAWVMSGSMTVPLRQQMKSSGDVAIAKDINGTTAVGYDADKPVYAHRLW